MDEGFEGRGAVPGWNGLGIEGTVVAENDHRPGLTGTSFLLLAIKAIMQCYTMRVPTPKHDKTIQMPQISQSLPLNFYALSLLDAISMRMKRLLSLLNLHTIHNINTNNNILYSSRLTLFSKFYSALQFINAHYGMRLSREPSF